ncbi:MAG TPA: CpsB/CapC family capsule biosynthesis tyrosine phosphatase [Thermoanaerobaculia bacterium]|nr:CpsB/CapC family capsule biosynthesis tyrosine phosphatase [Thermoanaerobaculia bacterium]
MIDLHTHVLPGIDDGAPDLPTAVAMCRMAAADGCQALVATPHQRTPRWENLDRRALEALRGRLADELGGAIEIHLGGEVRVDSELLAELAAAGADHGPLSLAGSRYLLVELDRHRLLVDPREVLHELLVAGWRPIFAHPEMIAPLAADPDLLAELGAGGALFQLTAAAVTGELGRTPRQVCQRLLDAGLAHFVASDTHGTDLRPPGLSRARRVIAARWGEETAARLTRDNPRAVLEDRPLPALAAAETAGAARLAH